MSIEIASQMTSMNRNIDSLLSRFGKKPLVADQVYVKENHEIDMYPMAEPMPPRKKEVQVVYPSHQSRQ